MDKAKRIIVVLGMHRSGTSAITRGLEVLGVELGEQLLAAASNDNDKGYFEDEEIFNLNVKVLETLGYDWKTSADISDALLNSELLQPLRVEAVKLLRARIEKFNLYGFKDPRVVKLLPFWQSIFDELNLEPSYLIVIRHPMSVVRSLAADNKRGDIQDEKGYLLWLDHVLLSHALTHGATRIVVEYDVMMEQPVVELARIAKGFDLPFDENSQDNVDFVDGFLTNSLRHTKFTIDDLAKAERAPTDVVAVYTHMQKYAKDIVSIDDHDELSAMNACMHSFNKFQPVFNYIEYIDVASRQQDAMRLQDHKYINELNVILKKYEETNQKISNENVNLQTDIINIQAEKVTLEADKITLEADKITLEADKITLEAEKAMNQSQLAKQIKKQERLTHLLVSQNQMLDVIRDSKSWRITKPIRFVGRQYRNVCDKLFK